MSYQNRGNGTYSRGGRGVAPGHPQYTTPSAYEMNFLGFNPLMAAAQQQAQIIGGTYPATRQPFGMPGPAYNPEAYNSYKKYIDRIREELSMNGRFKLVEEYFRDQNEYSLEDTKKDLQFLDEIKRPMYDYEVWQHFEKFRKESDESIDPSKLILKLCQVVLKMMHQYVPHDQGNRKLRVVQFFLKEKNVLEFTFVCANNKKANKAAAIEALRIIFPEIYDIILYNTLDQVGMDAIEGELRAKQKLKEEMDSAHNDIYSKCFKGCKWVGDVKVEDTSGKIGNKEPEASESDSSFKERCTSRMFSTISNNLLQKNAGRSLNFETKLLRKVQPEKSLEGEPGNEYEIVATDNHGKKYFRAQLICQNKTDAKQISGLKFIELFAKKVYFLIYRLIMGRAHMDELFEQANQQDSQDQSNPTDQKDEDPDHGAQPLYSSYDDDQDYLTPIDPERHLVQGQSNAMFQILDNLDKEESDQEQEQAQSMSVTSSERDADSEELYPKDPHNHNTSTRLPNDESESPIVYTAFSILREYLKMMFGLEIVGSKDSRPFEPFTGNFKNLPSETVLTQNLAETLNAYLSSYGYKLLALPQKLFDSSREAVPINISSFRIRFILEKEDKQAGYSLTEGMWDYDVRAANAHYTACLNYAMVDLTRKLFPILGEHLAFNSIRSWLGLPDTSRSLQLSFPKSAVAIHTQSRSSVSNSFTSEAASLSSRPQEQLKHVQSEQPKAKPEAFGGLQFMREVTPIPSPGLTVSQAPYSVQSTARSVVATNLITELGIRKACEAVECFAENKKLMYSNQNLIEEIKRFERFQGNLDTYFEYKLKEFEITGIYFHEQLNRICSTPDSNYDGKIKKKEQFLSHIDSNVKADDYASALNSVIHSIFKESLDVKTDTPYITFELNGRLLAVMNVKVQNKKIAKKVISMVLLRKLWPELYFEHVIKQPS